MEILIPGLDDNNHVPTDPEKRKTKSQKIRSKTEKTQNTKILYRVKYL